MTALHWAGRPIDGGDKLWGGGQMTLIAANDHVKEGLIPTCPSSVLPSHDAHSLCNPSLCNSVNASFTYKIGVPPSAPSMTATGYFYSSHLYFSQKYKLEFEVFHFKGSGCNHLADKSVGLLTSPSQSRSDWCLWLCWGVPRSTCTSYYTLIFCRSSELFTDNLTGIGNLLL